MAVCGWVWGGVEWIWGVWSGGYDDRADVAAKTRTKTQDGYAGQWYCTPTKLRVRTQRVQVVYKFNVFIWPPTSSSKQA